MLMPLLIFFSHFDAFSLFFIIFDMLLVAFHATFHDDITLSLFAIIMLPLFFAAAIAVIISRYIDVFRH